MGETGMHGRGNLAGSSNGTAEKQMARAEGRDPGRRWARPGLFVLSVAAAAGRQLVLMRVIISPTNIRHVYIGCYAKAPSGCCLLQSAPPWAETPRHRQGGIA